MYYENHAENQHECIPRRAPRQPATRQQRGAARPGSACALCVLDAQRLLRLLHRVLESVHAADVEVEAVDRTARGGGGQAAHLRLLLAAAAAAAHLGVGAAAGAGRGARPGSHEHLDHLLIGHLHLFHHALGQQVGLEPLEGDLLRVVAPRAQQRRRQHHDPEDGDQLLHAAPGELLHPALAPLAGGLVGLLCGGGGRGGGRGGVRGALRAARRRYPRLLCPPHLWRPCPGPRAAAACPWGRTSPTRGGDPRC